MDITTLSEAAKNWGAVSKILFCTGKKLYIHIVIVEFISLLRYDPYNGMRSEMVVLSRSYINIIAYLVDSLIIFPFGNAIALTWILAVKEQPMLKIACRIGFTIQGCCPIFFWELYIFYVWFIALEFLLLYYMVMLLMVDVMEDKLHFTVWIWMEQYKMLLDK